MVFHSLLQWATFCQTSPPWPACLGWPYRAWLSFIELDKAVVHSVSALWYPLATPTVLLGFLLPWTWGISSWLLQQSAATAPYVGWGVSLHGCSSKVQPLLLTLDEGYLLTTAPPDLECGVAPLGPPAPAQPPHAPNKLLWVSLPRIFCAITSVL